MCMVFIHNLLKVCKTSSKFTTFKRMDLSSSLSTEETHILLDMAEQAVSNWSTGYNLQNVVILGRHFNNPQQMDKTQNKEISVALVV